MRAVFVIVVAAAMAAAATASEQWVVRLADGVAPEVFAVEHGLEFLGEHVPHLAGYYVMYAPSHPLSPAGASGHKGWAAYFAAQPDVHWAERQYARKQYKRKAGGAEPRDPLYPYQWHLRGSWGVNAPYAWAQGLSGAGVTIAVVDDGLQHAHPELHAAYDALRSWDYNGRDSDPTPDRGDGHGTAAAGVALARRDNGHCGSGVAPAARLVGLRLIAGPVSDYTEALALGHHRATVDVYSCSWGPSDDAEGLVAPGHLLERTLDEGARLGRGGRGNVFVWAGGNGRDRGDNCNYDGYANSPHTLAIGALDITGSQAWYSEPCAALMAVAPSSGHRQGITTADLLGADGYAPGECTSTFGGTSSAAPLAAGIVALLLERYPQFTKRDVEHVIARGGVPVLHDWSSDWSRNARDYQHSHRYGFGLLRLPELLAVAAQHRLVPPQRRWASQPHRVAASAGVIPDSPTQGQHWESAPIAGPAEITFVEHVLVTLDALHARRGELQVELVSPEGIVSVLATPHRDAHRNFPAGGWRYTSVRHWGERGAGEWRLRVTDGVPNNGNGGRVVAYRLEVWGHA